jgi:RNA polymerase sigma-70 factor (ECF subfamily)
MTHIEVVSAPLDDVTLVSRARDGDVRAYETLVLRYQGQMYRFALRMLANRSDAEDVVQEVFLTAWRRLDQLQEGAAFVAWLYKATTNRCLNVIRARKPQMEVEPDAHEATDPLPERSAEVGEQMAALSRALLKLTDEQRACWLLREVHSRSYDEIAQHIGSSVTVVRGRIARARVQLAEVMAPWR